MAADKPTKTLLLMRHAKSSWKDESLDDHDRPLNKRGKQDAPTMGRLLREENLLPDFVVASTARRARKTADHVALASGYRGEMLLTSALYHANPEQTLDVLHNIDASHSRVLLIGHNPGLEELLEKWTSTYRPIPTAAIVHVQFKLKSWHQLSLTTDVSVAQVWQPRELS